eukprot:16446561-Heterocapsa_arctica.AAC.1
MRRVVADHVHVGPLPVNVVIAWEIRPTVDGDPGTKPIKDGEAEATQAGPVAHGDGDEFSVGLPLFPHMVVRPDGVAVTNRALNLTLQRQG